MSWTEPYGPLIDTRVRLLTWNVWGEYGPHAERTRQIEKVVRELSPDVVTLQEWAGQSLGYEHSAAGSGALPCAVLSRWPITRREERHLAGGAMPGSVLFCELAGPRGPLQVFSVIIGSFRLDESEVRQAQVRALTAFVGEVAGRRHPAVVCGDFNAPPDSDEIRMLTGRSAPGTPGVVFYDSWEVAGDGGPGHTWSNANPWARPGLYPDRRFDYVLSAWPRAGGAGHPVRCEVVGDGPQPASDHYAVLAELRY
ncbi:endonuclease/exonuclease/phosphatase family protein [Nonomuraea zeae]|uniref:Endonuclease/exonuclease/phosphatase family protein n=1 Tax=Nonomuraea zeae TaxID=1642303 RepID=A0A5S4GFP4_9ACTN|nr:endonuclease/exonuclease/phosphatase family protein [Nonomuraea zeae]TMR31788.1 endonuclease/exonuclease/phosphatase family protein [Nonomuraea zeae]